VGIGLKRNGPKTEWAYVGISLSGDGAYRSAPHRRARPAQNRTCPFTSALHSPPATSAPGLTGLTPPTTGRGLPTSTPGMGSPHGASERGLAHPSAPGLGHPCRASGPGLTWAHPLSRMQTRAWLGSPHAVHCAEHGGDFGRCHTVGGRPRAVQVAPVVMSVATG
jgi:hypothetical protein